MTAATTKNSNKPNELRIGSGGVSSQWGVLIELVTPKGQMDNFRIDGDTLVSPQASKPIRPCPSLMAEIKAAAKQYRAAYEDKANGKAMVTVEAAMPYSDDYLLTQVPGANIADYKRVVEMFDTEHDHCFRTVWIRKTPNKATPIIVRFSKEDML